MYLQLSEQATQTAGPEQGQIQAEANEHDKKAEKNSKSQGLCCRSR